LRDRLQNGQMMALLIQHICRQKVVELLRQSNFSPIQQLSLDIDLIRRSIELGKV